MWLSHKLFHWCGTYCSCVYVASTVQGLRLNIPLRLQAFRTCPRSRCFRSFWIQTKEKNSNFSWCKQSGSTRRSLMLWKQFSKQSGQSSLCEQNQAINWHTPKSVRPWCFRNVIENIKASESAASISISKRVWKRIDQSISRVFSPKNFLFLLICGLVSRRIFRCKLERTESIKWALVSQTITFLFGSCRKISCIIIPYVPATIRTLVLVGSRENSCEQLTRYNTQYLNVGRELHVILHGDLVKYLSQSIPLDTLCLL